MFQVNSLEEFQTRHWLEIRQRAGGWTLYPYGMFDQMRGDDTTDEPVSSIQAILPQLSRRGPLVLTMPTSRCFVRNFNVAGHALHRVNQLAELDLQRLLPPHLGKVAAGLHVSKAGAFATVEQVAIRQTDLADTVSQLADYGLDVQAITFRHDDGTWCPVVMAPGGAPFAFEIHKRWLTALAASIITMVVSAGTLVGAQVFNSAAWLAQVEDAKVRLAPQIEAVKSQISAYREKADSLRQIEQWLGEHGSPIAAIEGLSKRLPDDAYLGALSYRGGAIDMNGYSRTPQELISVLEKSDEFSAVNFTSPVYRNAGEDYARVSVTIRSERAAATEALR